MVKKLVEQAKQKTQNEFGGKVEKDAKEDLKGPLIKVTGCK